MTRIFSWMGLCMLACAALAGAASAQTWDETTNGGGDAGDLPGTAQSITGSGPLTVITGSNPVNADRDFYRIRISSPATFSATSTITPGTNLDTQFWLFHLTGVGIAHNDDTAANFLSTFPAANALYASLPAGEYLFAVTSYNSDASSAAGSMFPSAFGGVVVGPTGVGGGTNVMTSWTTSSTTDFGTYRVTLTGCDLISPPSEIDVQRPVGISLGAGTAPVADALGNVPITGQSFTYTIANSGAGTLNLTGAPNSVALSAQVGCTAAVTQPATTTVAPAASTSFSVNVTPSAAAAFSFTLTIASNDADEGSYVINVSGTGFNPNLPAVATLPGGSSFTGALNGPFSQSVAPGASLAVAAIELTDPESDTITVTSIVPPATALSGVTEPALPAPGHPVVLTWTGAVDAANTPGDYTWTVTFSDAVNGTPVVVDITISVLDVAPTHVPVAGVTGLGSAGAPYLATYTVGLGGTVSVNLADVSDANSNQVVSISGTSDVSALGGTGFQFMLVAGQLVGSPAGTLVAADTGVQVWEVTVTDGNNPVIITVSITVNAAISFTSSTTLTAAERNGAYPGSTITVTGGTGAVSMAITGGALPANLSMSSAGVVSGITTDAVASYNFTVTATDSLGASTALAFSIDVVDPAAGLPTITNGATLPSGTLNVAYNLSLTVSGGTSPYTFSITGGSLPSGLSMSAAGVISGTPSAVGPSSFTVRVQDSSSRGVFNSSAFTLAVVAPKKEEDSSDCTAGAGGAGVLALLAPLGTVLMRRRRR